MFSAALASEVVEVRRRVRITTGKGGFRKEWASMGTETIHYNPGSAGEASGQKRPEANLGGKVYAGPGSVLLRGDVLIRSEPFLPRFLELVSVRTRTGGGLSHVEAQTIERERAPK